MLPLSAESRVICKSHSRISCNIRTKYGILLGKVSESVMKQPFALILLWTVWCLPFGTVRSAQGDRFVLTTGGELVGRMVDADESWLRIATDAGVTVQVHSSMIEQRIVDSPARSEYHRRLAGAAQTADSQWDLARWCKEHQLADEAKRHLHAVLKLAPNHAEARRSLGYNYVSGRWVVPDELRREKGYVRYRGRWMLPQQVELYKRRRAKQLAEKSWMTRIHRWRSDLQPETSNEFANNIGAIDDPSAVPALAKQLTVEPLRPIKLLYIKTLQQIDTSAAMRAVMHASLNDPDEEIFYECLDVVKETSPAEAVRTYVDALQNENNVRINRAALILAALEEPSTIPPLIDALVTTHRIATQNRSSDTMSTTFAKPGSQGGGTGLSAGAASQTFTQTVTNQQVLNALVQLSGGRSFGFDQRAWRYWYATEERQRSASRSVRK